MATFPAASPTFDCSTLTVNGDATEPLMLLNNSGAAGTNAYLYIKSGNAGIGMVDFGDTDSTGRGKLEYNHSTDAFALTTAGSQRLTLSSTGVLNLSQLTASSIVQTDGSKNLVSSNDLPDGTTVNGESITKTLWTNSTYATVANTTTQTSILGAGTGSLTIAADRFVAGTAIRLRLAGSLSTKSSAAGYLKFHFYWKAASSTNTVQSASLTSSLSGATWSLDIAMNCYTTGTVGSMGASVRGLVLNSSAGFEYCFTKDTNSVLNTTTASPIDVKVEWETADVSNTITMYTASLEILNG